MLLEKLTPREDLDGYEYKEGDVERRRRNRLQIEFDRKLRVRYFLLTTTCFH